MAQEQTSPKVLIIYFSLSGQTRGLINLLALGLKDAGVGVEIEQLKACKKISFPFRNILHTLQMMLLTFCRSRTPIESLHPCCFDAYDLIVLSGPTWSYNPSGPILSLFDRDGQTLFSGQRVLPLISCRGYYRLHDYFLRKILRELGAELEHSLIFKHPVSEPWSTVGVFLKSAGYAPEKIAFFSKHYPHFGHTTSQLNHIRSLGHKIALNLTRKRDAGSP